MKKISIKKLNEVLKSIADNWSLEDDARLHRDHIGYIRSCARMGIPQPQETKDKISLSSKGRPVVVVTCPNCGKEGGYAAMYRWHFDKCKFTQSVA